MTDNITSMSGSVVFVRDGAVFNRHCKVPGVTEPCSQGVVGCTLEHVVPDAEPCSAPPQDPKFVLCEDEGCDHYGTPHTHLERHAPFALEKDEKDEEPPSKKKECGGDGCQGCQGCTAESESPPESAAPVSAPEALRQFLDLASLNGVDLGDLRSAMLDAVGLKIDPVKIGPTSKLHHAVDPCPLCSTEVDIMEWSDQTFTIECPTCKLMFGLPHGYSSRLALTNDWSRHTFTELTTIEANDHAEVRRKAIDAFDYILAWAGLAHGGQSEFLATTVLAELRQSFDKSESPAEMYQNER